VRYLLHVFIHIPLSYMSNLKLEFKFKFKFRLWFRMRASVCERRAYCLNEGEGVSHMLGDTILLQNHFDKNKMNLLQKY